MLLGALLHAGVDFKVLQEQLSTLGLGEFQFTIQNVIDNGITAIKVDIDSKRRQELRTLSSLLTILDTSTLSNTVCNRSAAVFTAIATAEAKVHGTNIEKIHFHEIGALDTLVDVIGTNLCLEMLDIGTIVCSPLPQPRGFITCAHGRIPLPAPAVCELLNGIPSYGVDLEQELVTPTGAALVKVLTTSFGSMPSITQEMIGYGAGSHILSNGQPNLLRIFVGDGHTTQEDQLVEIIETNLDDWNPEGFPYVCEKLFKHGALDVSLTAIQMKKGRPGFCLQIISGRTTTAILKEILLSETTAIGLRYRQEFRKTLPRKVITVSTQWGDLLAKEVETPTGKMIYPEYEECKKLAERENVPLQKIYNTIQGMN